jgi:hypothetical protein
MNWSVSLSYNITINPINSIGTVAHRVTPMARRLTLCVKVVRQFRFVNTGKDTATASLT